MNFTQKTTDNLIKKFNEKNKLHVYGLYGVYLWKYTDGFDVRLMSDA